MFEPTDSQYESAREERINDAAAEILNKEMWDLFLDMEDADQFIKDLYTAGVFGLTNLQERFRVRIAHEAMAVATRRFDSGMKGAFLKSALRDENELTYLGNRR